MGTNKDVNLIGEARKEYMETVAKKSVNLSEDERKAFMDALTRDSLQTTEAKQNRVYSQRGDDYLLEAQRVCGEDKRGQDKPTPRCPYCGGEMKNRVLSDYGMLCFWRCPKCRATSPSANTAEDAYTAAIQRWQEPNSVLTLEEVRGHCKQGADAAPLWVEVHNSPSMSRWMVVCPPDEAFCNDTIRNYCRSLASVYKKSWRCWLRKPTAEEIAAMPWRRK